MRTTPDIRNAPPIIELRQYLLQPGRRDDLIELFDREFVETQEAVGIDVVGQFRDLDRPDYFVWLRGFDDMESRRQSLAAFYGGPVWAAHRDAANATMIDSDNVLLLRPVSTDSELHSGDPSSRDHHSTHGAIVTLIQHREPGREADYNRFFETTMQPQLDATGARTLGVYETEPAENDFPRLPVRDANVLVWFAAFDSPAELDNAWLTLQNLSASSSNEHQAREVSDIASDVMRLTPTSRSLLDGTARGIDRRVDR
jgi:NIPSNAP